MINRAGGFPEFSKETIQDRVARSLRLFRKGRGHALRWPIGHPIRLLKLFMDRPHHSN
jgi:hypothetical protein